MQPKTGKLEKFKELLDSQHEWPTQYTFKFIVPNQKQKEVEALFPNHPIAIRESSQGKYVSVSITLKIECSDIVIAVYEKASLIEGLIAL